jgi:hypothetical protein
MKKGHQHGAEEEKEDKIQEFSKKFLPREHVHQNLGN